MHVDVELGAATKKAYVSDNFQDFQDFVTLARLGDSFTFLSSCTSTTNNLENPMHAIAFTINDELRITNHEPKEKEVLMGRSILHCISFAFRPKTLSALKKKQNTLSFQGQTPNLRGFTLTAPPKFPCAKPPSTNPKRYRIPDPPARDHRLSPRSMAHGMVITRLPTCASASISILTFAMASACSTVSS